MENTLLTPNIKALVVAHIQEWAVNNPEQAQKDGVLQSVLEMTSANIVEFTPRVAYTLGFIHGEFHVMRRNSGKIEDKGDETLAGIILGEYAGDALG